MTRTEMKLQGKKFLVYMIPSFLICFAPFFPVAIGATILLLLALIGVITVGDFLCDRTDIGELLRRETYRDPQLFDLDVEISLRHIELAEKNGTSTALSRQAETFLRYHAIYAARELRRELRQKRMSCS